VVTPLYDSLSAVISSPLSFCNALTVVFETYSKAADRSSGLKSVPFVYVVMLDAASRAVAVATAGQMGMRMALRLHNGVLVFRA